MKPYFDPLPDSLTIIRNDPDKLVLKYVWFQLHSLFFIAFGILAGYAVWNDEPTEKLNTLQYIILVPFHIGLLCFGLAYLLNRTIIAADHNSLRIRHYPIPWIPCTIPVAQITALTIKENRYHRSGEHYRNDYDIIAHRKDKTKELVIGSFESETMAEEIQRHLAKHLAIQQSTNPQDAT